LKTPFSRKQYQKNRSFSRHHRFQSPATSAPAQGEIKLNVHPRVRKLLGQIGIPEARPFQPDPFQVEALEALDQADVLVSAPTGAGKTYIAIAAIRQVLATGGSCWYASPLKALSNAKFEEFSDIFSRQRVGILTGDRKENVNAPIIVGTTEILRNQLYDAMHRGEDLGVDLVVLDEAHYLGDMDRGVVWEEVLIYLPQRIRILLLSATIQNAQQVCDWLTWLRKSPCRLVAAYQRPVPLFPLFLFPSGELVPLSTRRGLFAPIRGVTSKDFSRRDFPHIAGLLSVLRQANLLPAIFFLKSRADCEKAITLSGPAVTVGDVQGRARAFRSRLRKLLDLYPFLSRHQHLEILRRSRVGAHHGGQLPHWKLLLEKLMQEGLLEAIFSTSTVAAGVNFPARTVVILQSDRFNGRDFVDLSATDLLQMTGRAGRRGMDEIGFVLVVPGPYQDAQLIHDLLRSPPDPIHSQIRINFSMVLNLLLSHEPEEIRQIFTVCLATYQNLSGHAAVSQDMERIQQELQEWLPEMTCGSMEALAEVRPQYTLLREQLRKSYRKVRRQGNAYSLQALLEPGRLFQSRRGTPYVVLGPVAANGDAVEAVRLHPPLRFRDGQVRAHAVRLHRIKELGEQLTSIPGRHDRQTWEALVSRHAERPFQPLSQEAIQATLGVENQPPELAQLGSLTFRKASLPCGDCALFGPCHKSDRHPFARLLRHYFDRLQQLRTVQDQLWRSFLHHFHVLQNEGYVNADGRLTDDGLWASKLRLDQPLLISEVIRQQAFPEDQPALLAALIAPFVFDRDRPGDTSTGELAFRYPELAEPFFRMMQALQSLRQRLEEAGFELPPLPFWSTVIVYHWARGESWEALRKLTGMDEGDLAMVILRTADHLRQIESLTDTHSRLAASAHHAITIILREPVLVE
jgi:ATP-dependent RNA helicase HelY